MVFRRLLIRCACLLPAVTATALHAACPPNPDITAPMDDLLAQVQAAETEREGRIIANRMWQHWTKAPDSYAQGLLDEGMQRRQAFDLAGAIVAFDALTAYCPDFAEGFNQRAFANFLRGDYAAALPDLDRAIDLSPRHVAALAGKGLTLISLGRVAEGQAVIREALVLNPWLSERQYLNLPVTSPKDGIEL